MPKSPAKKKARSAAPPEVKLEQPEEITGRDKDAEILLASLKERINDIHSQLYSAIRGRNLHLVKDIERRLRLKNLSLQDEVDCPEGLVHAAVLVNDLPLFHYFCKKRPWEIETSLISHGGGIGGTVLHLAIYLERAEMLDHLLEIEKRVRNKGVLGINIKAYQCTFQPNAMYKPYPLELAINSDDVDVIEQLIGFGSNLGTAAISMYPISLAIQQKSVRALNYFLQNFDSKQLNMEDREVKEIIASADATLLRCVFAKMDYHSIGTKALYTAVMHPDISMLVVLLETMCHKDCGDLRIKINELYNSASPLVVTAYMYHDIDQTPSSNSAMKAALLLIAGADRGSLRIGKSALELATERKADKLCKVLASETEQQILSHFSGEARRILDSFLAARAKLVL